MLTSRRNEPNPTRPPLIIPNRGNQLQQQQAAAALFAKSSHRPLSKDSTQSIDNAYSLEHLFIGLRRRIHRIVQTYNVTTFDHALKICARVFRSYASYNLNTIDEFARLLNKGSRDNRKLLAFIDQFRLHLAELRHCHSTFEIELLVTTLAIDFHENDLEHQPLLPLSTGKFSPRSRLSKFRFRHIRQAMELKSQLKKTNEHLQILLFDEFNADLSYLWNESDKYVTTSIQFPDRHMIYILRLIPDVALKFEYALQLCTKLFDLETAMLDSYQQTNRRRTSPPPPPMLMELTPRMHSNRKIENLPQPRIKSNKKSQKSSAFFSAEVTSASSVSSITKFTHVINSPIPPGKREAPSMNIMHPREERPVLSLAEKPPVDRNDQIKLRLLIDQFDRRLIEEDAYRQRLLHCLQQTAKKSEQLNQFPKPNMLALVMSENPAVAEYQKALYRSDYHVHKNMADELNIAVRETQHRIDWINMVRTRAQQCLIQDKPSE